MKINEMDKEYIVIRKIRVQQAEQPMQQPRSSNSTVHYSSTAVQQYSSTVESTVRHSSVVQNGNDT